MRLPPELLGDLCGCHPVPAKPIILELHAAGMGWTDIARRLNVDAVPTPTGKGKWHSQTVRRHVDPAPWAAYMRQRRAMR